MFLFVCLHLCHEQSNTLMHLPAKTLPTMNDEKAPLSAEKMAFDLSAEMDASEEAKNNANPFRMPTGMCPRSITDRDTKTEKVFKAIETSHYELWQFVSLRKLPMRAGRIQQNLRAKLVYWNLGYHEALTQFENLFAMPIISILGHKWYVPLRIWHKLSSDEQSNLVNYCDREDNLRREGDKATKRKAYRERKGHPRIGRPPTDGPVFNINTNPVTPEKDE